MTTTDSLTALTSFYEKANLLLRIALFIALTWPLSALAVAMFASPNFAQTAVPLVDMIPVLAIFFIILAAPFGLVLVLRDPQAKKGFLYFAGFIGLELTIGVYLSLIPVEKDTGLVPLLILSALALLFLRIANIFGAIRVILGIILIGITIVFLSGGRAALKSQFNAAITPQPSPTNQQPPVQQTLTAHQTNPTNTLDTVPVDPPLPRQPKPFLPNWNNVQLVEVEDFTAFAPPCIRRAGFVHCFIRITNRSDERGVEIDNKDWRSATRMIDDLGNEYRANAVKIGASTDLSRANASLPTDIPVLGWATFENVVGSRVAYLEFNFNYPINRQFVIRFKNLSINREESHEDQEPSVRSRP